MAEGFIVRRGGNNVVMGSITISSDRTSITIKELINKKHILIFYAPPGSYVVISSNDIIGTSYDDGVVSSWYYHDKNISGDPRLHKKTNIVTFNETTGTFTTSDYQFATGAYCYLGY